MEINITLLESHFKKNGYSATVNVPIGSAGSHLIFIAGTDKEGNRREALTPVDMDNILKRNHIVGEQFGDKSLVQDQFDLAKTDTTVSRITRYQKAQDLVYDTLARYIIQLLISSTGDVWYPELIPLDQHKLQFTKR